MTRDYPPLATPLLSPDAQLPGTATHSVERPNFETPALEAMTDFTRIPAATIEPSATVDEANQFMIRRGVRALMVVDPSLRLLGIITANDVLGEGPVKVALERNVRHNEVLVRDVMTPAERLEALQLDEVAAAKIGHIVTTLARAGRQHTLVVESGPQGQTIRGIFSLTHIASELGIPIEVPVVARTFAEVEAALR